MADSRGVSNTVGVVIIFGMTLVMTTVVVGAGSIVMTDMMNDLEQSNAEQSMSQAAAKASLVTLDHSNAQSFSVGDTGGGSVSVDGDAGNVNVSIAREDGSTETLIDDSYGALVYENEDVEIALQGGGVWRAADGGSRMVSPPEYHYESMTLTFPIVQINGDDSAGGSVDGRLLQGETENLDPSGTNPLDDGVVVVEVQSEYYEGWYEFFEARAGGSTVKYDSNQTVVSELVVPQEAELD